jgi:tetratricopeptide (TPR) repeat protein
MKLLRMVCVVLLLFVSGCTTVIVGDVMEIVESRQPQGIDTTKAFDESKIVYMAELRGYAYQAGEKLTESDLPLFDRSGRKIRSRDEAIEHIRSVYSDPGLSPSETALASVSIGYGLPVSMLFGAAENIALLPAFPYAYYLQGKFEKEVFENYTQGRKLIEEGNYSLAREKLSHSLRRAKSLLYQSDIFFMVAEAYRKENRKELAAKYYRIFLDYSTSQYPAYFKDYGELYTSDRKKLDAEFTLAESYLKMHPDDAASETGR